MEFTQQSPLLYRWKRSSDFSDWVPFRWANFQDIGVAPLPKFDWPAYLDMMLKHNHNFMRFWHWMQAAYAPWTDEKMLVVHFPISAVARDGARRSAEVPGKNMMPLIGDLRIVGRLHSEREELRISAG